MLYNEIEQMLFRCLTYLVNLFRVVLLVDESIVGEGEKLSYASSCHQLWLTQYKLYLLALLLEL